MLVIAWLWNKDRDGSGCDGRACNDNGRNGYQANDDLVVVAEAIEDDAECENGDEGDRGYQSDSFDNPECQEWDFKGDDDESVGRGASDDEGDCSGFQEIRAPCVVHDWVEPDQCDIDEH